MRVKNLFISHSWTYSNEYERLVNLLAQAKHFSYKDYSVPQDSPIHRNGTNRQLRDAIAEQIRQAQVVLVLAGVYSAYSRWINIEIEIAKEEFSWEKPIIAIEGRGSERTSQHVKDNANMIVKWNTNSIVNAIRRLT